MGSGSRALLLAAVLGAACAGAPDPSAPAPESVEPAAGFLALETPVVIRGRDFLVRASQGVEGAGEDRVDARFRAWLGGVELREVTWVDAGTLSAVVPADALAEGDHELVVEGPYGTRGALAGAYAAVAAAGGMPPGLEFDPVAVPSVVAPGGTVTIRVHVTNAGPGAIDPFLLQLRNATDGRGIGQPLPGALVGAGPIPYALAEGIPDALPEGQWIDVEYVITAPAEVGTYQCEVKAGGSSPANGGTPLPSRKVLVSYDVVEPGAPAP
jgi:hypothetical protein